MRRGEIFNEGGFQNIENDNERVGLVGCLQDKIIWDKYIQKISLISGTWYAKIIKYYWDMWEIYLNEKVGVLRQKGGSFNKLKSKAFSGAI